MPNLEASGAAEILTVSQHIVTAIDGLVTLSAQGDDSSVNLRAESVWLETLGSYISLLNSKVGGAVNISASGEAASINLSTPTSTAGSQIMISPSGILLRPSRDAGGHRPHPHRAQTFGRTAGDWGPNRDDGSLHCAQGRRDRDRPDAGRHRVEGAADRVILRGDQGQHGAAGN